MSIENLSEAPVTNETTAAPPAAEQPTAPDLSPLDIGEMSDAEIAERLGETSDAPKPESTVDDPLKRQLEEKEKFIQRQANELGELRKLKAEFETRQQQQAIAPVQTVPQAPPPAATPAFVELTPDQLVALNLEDPLKVLEYHEAKKAHDAQVRQQASLERFNQVKQLAPDLEEYAGDIALVMKERDNFDPGYITQLAQNIHSMPPDMLYSFYDRAKLFRENKALKAEIESLKGKPGRMLDKIEKASKASFLTAASGQGNPPASIDTKDVASMSDKDLNEALRQRGVKI